MKKILMISLMVCTIITYSQKKKNGTIYNEHPAIDAVEALNKAFVDGDADAVANLLTDDYKWWNGTTANKDAKPGTKKGSINNVKWWKENMTYVSFDQSSNSYPDAIEYKDEDEKDWIWVQTWNDLKGVHNKTGVKIDAPVHRLYRVNSDNKINMIINYSNGRVWQEVRESHVNRKNGSVYNRHEYINKVRLLMVALEHQDMDKFYSFFDEKATFRNVHMPVGSKAMTLEEDKEAMKSMMEDFEFTGIDVQGYPDYINYALDNSSVVQSWWKVRMTRKSDKKKLVIPVHTIHDFNDEGKIIGESVYFSLTLMNAK